MRIQKTIYLLCLLLLTTACSYVPKLDEVIPDRRTEYKKSEAMPDLEVPPDLTVNNDTDPMAIPNEEASTLSQFENQKKMRQVGAGPTAGTQGKGDESWLSVQGTNADIWPRLKEFWANKGFTLDLDDQDLGVLETNWREIIQGDVSTSRIKYSIFTEAGSSPGSTVLFLDSRKEDKSVDKDGKEAWVESPQDTELEKQMIGELNLHFYGAKPAAASTAPAKQAAAPAPAPEKAAPEKAVPAEKSAAGTSTSGGSVSGDMAQIEKLDEDKIYLSIPAEFNRAWTITEVAIKNAGMLIDGQDREKGLYDVTYTGQTGEQKKKGILSKLKFWGDKGESRKYMLNLTGVGEKTELVVLNEEGDWASKEEASVILTLLQNQFNAVDE